MHLEIFLDGLLDIVKLCLRLLQRLVHLHTYIHTYICTYIHTYIHRCIHIAGARRVMVAGAHVHCGGWRWRVWGTNSLGNGHTVCRIPNYPLHLLHNKDFKETARHNITSDVLTKSSTGRDIILHTHTGTSPTHPLQIFIERVILVLSADENIDDFVDGFLLGLLLQPLERSLVSTHTDIHIHTHRWVYCTSNGMCVWR